MLKQKECIIPPGAQTYIDLTKLFLVVTVFVMRKLLPILIILTAILTPLYPVYAQGFEPALRPSKNASATGSLKPAINLEGKMTRLEDKIASRSALLREKLLKFKDKNKANRVQEVNTNLNAVNSRATSQMSEVLQKISGFLERLKEKTAKAESEGKEVSAANAAIATVEIQWNEADAAIKAQTEKDYSIVINTEATVASDAASARTSLRTDLQATHMEVVQARQALSDAIATTLSLIKGGNNGNK